MANIDLNDLFPVASDGSRGPLPRQADFLRLCLDPKGPQHVGYYGGYGSGKSLVLVITTIIQAVVYGGEYVVARAFMPELRRTTMALFLDLLPKELLLDYQVARAEVHIKSASGHKAIVYFVGLDDPGKLDSLNLSGVAIDEASQTTEEAFLKLQGRLRNPLGLRKIMLAGNPKGHDFVYRKFIKQDSFADLENLDGSILTAEQQKAQYRMILAPSTENKHLPDGYIQNMLSSYSKERIMRDIYGSFDSFEGMIYSEFRQDTHVIAPFAIPKNWTRVIGIDAGFRNPAAWIWVAVDYDSNFYVYREFYEREWLISEICKGKDGKPGVVKLMKGEEIQQARIDPSTKAVKAITGGSDFDAYVEHLPADFNLCLANNEVSAGIDRVKAALKINPKTKKPRLFIFNTCTNLIDEILSYRYEELNPGSQGKANDKEKPLKVKDHANDAMRYAIMCLPEAEKPKSDPIKHKHGTIERALSEELSASRDMKSHKDPWGND